MDWPFSPLSRNSYSLIMADPPWSFATFSPKGWGARYVSSGTWVKTTTSGKIAFGTGYSFRNAHEIILLGAFGRPKIASRSVRSVLMAPVREHSRKPEEAYTAARALIPDGRAADIFGRQARPGWDTWGNEAAKFDEVPA